LLSIVIYQAASQCMATENARANDAVLLTMGDSDARRGFLMASAGVRSTRPLRSNRTAVSRAVYVATVDLLAPTRTPIARSGRARGSAASPQSVRQSAAAVAKRQPLEQPERLPLQRPLQLQLHHNRANTS
ncbi:hypothetical protein PFISCL1PPCAC_14279, partial [Pristionchus fissidentatus]